MNGLESSRCDTRREMKGGGGAGSMSGDRDGADGLDVANVIRVRDGLL